MNDNHCEPSESCPICEAKLHAAETLGMGPEIIRDECIFASVLLEGLATGIAILKQEGSKKDFTDAVKKEITTLYDNLRDDCLKRFEVFYQRQRQKMN